MDALLGKYIGAGLTTFGMLGAAIGVGLIFASALNAIARNPSQEGKIKGFALMGMALAEFMGLLAFVVAILILMLLSDKLVYQPCKCRGLEQI